MSELRKIPNVGNAWTVASCIYTEPSNISSMLKIPIFPSAPGGCGKTNFSGLLPAERCAPNADCFRKPVRDAGK